MIEDRQAHIEFIVPPTPYLECDDIPGPDTKPSILVMEDMSKEGYQEPFDKITKGLGLEYTKLALVQIATFHACTYAYLKAYPGRCFMISSLSMTLNEANEKYLNLQEGLKKELQRIMSRATTHFASTSHPRQNQCSTHLLECWARWDKPFIELRLAEVDFLNI